MGEWAPDHEAQGFKDKVNAAVVHEKRMFLFGGVWPVRCTAGLGVLSIGKSRPARIRDDP